VKMESLVQKNAKSHEGILNDKHKPK